MHLVNRIALAFVSCLSCFSPAILAQIPKIAELSEFCLPVKQRCNLAAKRETVVALKQQLLNKIEQHNKKCTSVTARTSEEQTCSSAKASLETEKKSYAAEVTKFNQLVEQTKIPCDTNRGLVIPSQKIPNSADELPALENVPPALPNPPRSQLETRRLELQAEIKGVPERISSFNARCRIIFSGSPDEKVCPQEDECLGAVLRDYLPDAEKFNLEVRRAVDRHRMELEQKFNAANKALEQDATAVRNIGFSKRAAEFDAWEKMSEDARREASKKILGILVDAGSELTLKGILKQMKLMGTGTLGPEEARYWVAKIQDSGLRKNGFNQASYKYLQEVASGSTRGELNEFAELAYKDFKTAADLRSDEDGGYEKALSYLKFLAPPPIAAATDLAELSIWVVYDGVTQVVAASNVKRLTDLTVEELRSLAKIQCLMQKHMVERYKVAKQLEELTGRPTEVRKPNVSARCAMN